MTWDEFRDLLSGLNESTALVRVAQIRTETDPETLKQLSPEQRRMRSEWMRRRALSRPEKDVTAAISSMQQAFATMFGEG